MKSREEGGKGVTMRDDKQGQGVEDYNRSPVINLMWLLSSGN